MLGRARKVAVTVSTRFVYVKLTMCAVNRRIYRNTDTSTNSNPTQLYRNPL